MQIGATSLKKEVEAQARTAPSCSREMNQAPHWEQEAQAHADFSK